VPTSANAAYLDTSAFVKLIVEEPESSALEQSLIRWPQRVSSTLLRTETVRALRRAGHEEHVGKARRLFGAIRLIRLDEPLLDRAGELEPPELRSLDAMHLAAALTIGPDLGVVFTYDARLKQAASELGIITESPRG
jgi:uncharacterized protein